jgi:DNA polymerase-3 subunit gamma/tau
VPPEIDAPDEERVPNYAAASALRAGPDQGQPQGATPQNPGHQPSAQSAASQPAAGQPSAGQPSAGQPSAPAQRQHPNAGQRGTSKDPSRAPAFSEKQRYGEAVVREILGATFIEEQPYSAAPRTRNDN